MASRSNSSSGTWGLTSHPTVWTLAMVILFAVVLLAVLRHLFGSIRVEVGSR